jgi:hypothetical protein
VTTQLIGTSEEDSPVGHGVSRDQASKVPDDRLEESYDLVLVESKRGYMFYSSVDVIVKTHDDHGV